METTKVRKDKAKCSVCANKNEIQRTREKEQIEINKLLDDYVEEIALHLAIIGVNLKLADNLRGKVNTDVWESFGFIEEIILQKMIPIGYEKKFKNWLKQGMKTTPTKKKGKE